MLGLREALRDGLKEVEGLTLGLMLELILGLKEADKLGERLVDGDTLGDMLGLILGLRDELILGEIEGLTLLVTPLYMVDISVGVRALLNTAISSIKPAND